MTTERDRKRLTTAAAIDAIQPTGKREDYSDPTCRGLTLAVLPSGSKAWFFRYRNAAGQQRSLPLGRYDADRASDRVTLAQARKAADAARVAVRNGADPVSEKAAARERATLEADRLELGEVLKPSDTFATAWAKFDADHIAAALKPGTAAKWRAMYRNQFARRWDSRALNSIEAVDVAGMVHALRATPHAADTARMIARVFFKWASSGPARILTVNPAADIAKAKRSREAKAVNNERVLDDAELRWIWKACDRVNDYFGAVVRVLILTGQRRDEVSHMPKAELALAAKRWTIAGARSKNGKAHEIYLSDEAAAVLADVAVINDECPYVFSTDGETPLSGYSKFKTLLDEATAAVAAEECGEPVAIPNWRLHDLRRTFASGCARLGVSLQVVERCLNHSSGSLGGLVAVYNRHGYQQEQAAAWKQWGEHVAAVVKGDRSNVVPLVPLQVEHVPA